MSTRFLLFIVPDRISEREAEVSVDVIDLCAVECGGGIAIDSDGDALLAGELNALDNSRVGMRSRR